MGRLSVNSSTTCGNCGDTFGGKNYTEIALSCDYCSLKVGLDCCGYLIHKCNECGRHYCGNHVGYDLHGSRICNKCTPKWVSDDPNMQRFSR